MELEGAQLADSCRSIPPWVRPSPVPTWVRPSPELTGCDGADPETATVRRISAVDGPAAGSLSSAGTSSISNSLTITIYKINRDTNTQWNKKPF